MRRQHSNKVPASMQSVYAEISSLTDEYCKLKLDDDYKKLIRYAIAALARKRPSPLQKGRPCSWACGVIHAIGMTNFLFDKSFKPYVSSSELSGYFNLGQSTVSNKSKQIRDILKISRMDHLWMVDSRKEDSVMAWMISVNGFIVDARTMPLEIQQEAYDRGMIPKVVCS